MDINTKIKKGLLELNTRTSIAMILAGHFYGEGEDMCSTKMKTLLDDIHNIAVFVKINSDDNVSYDETCHRMIDVYKNIVG